MREGVETRSGREAFLHVLVAVGMCSGTVEEGKVMAIGSISLFGYATSQESCGACTSHSTVVGNGWMPIIWSS